MPLKKVGDCNQTFTVRVWNPATVEERPIVAVPMVATAEGIFGLGKGDEAVADLETAGSILERSREKALAQLVLEVRQLKTTITKDVNAQLNWASYQAMSRLFDALDDFERADGNGGPHLWGLGGRRR